MRATAWLLLGILFSGCMTGGPTSTTGPTPSTTTSATTATTGTFEGNPDLVAANTQFAVDLFRVVSLAEKGRNVFISPFSVSTALAMAYEGANGTTRRAMGETLGFSDAEDFGAEYGMLLASVTSPRAEVALEVGNSMWIDEAFEPFVRPEYRKDVVRDFDAEAQVLDFKDPAAPDAINAWASAETHGKVPKVLDSIAPDEVMFLVNAVYFKGDWAAPFNKTCTHKAPFARTDGSIVQADMMCGADMANVTHHIGADFSAARLPYAGHDVAMYVLLPPPGTTLAVFASRFDGPSLDAALDKVESRGADVRIPRFTLKTHLELESVLARLGMGVAFSDKADFSRIAGNLYLSRVLHDAVVEVDEEGTVAAAVTTVGVGIVSLPPRIDADRPFIVVIRDEATRSVLFMGAVEDPTQE